MKDLRDAIKKCILACTPAYRPLKSSDDKNALLGYFVPKECFEILLAEYNIYFVEPEDTQLEIEGYEYLMITTDNWRERNMN